MPNDVEGFLSDFIPRGVMRYIRRLLRMNRFPERTELEAMLQAAGLRIVDQRDVPELRGQVPVLAIGHV